VALDAARLLQAHEAIVDRRGQAISMGQSRQRHPLFSKWSFSDDDTSIIHPPLAAPTSRQNGSIFVRCLSINQNMVRRTVSYYAVRQTRESS